MPDIKNIEPGQTYLFYVQTPHQEEDVLFIPVKISNGTQSVPLKSEIGTEPRRIDGTLSHFNSSTV